MDLKSSRSKWVAPALMLGAAGVVTWLFSHRSEVVDEVPRRVAFELVPRLPAQVLSAVLALVAVVLACVGVVLLVRMVIAWFHSRATAPAEERPGVGPLLIMLVLGPALAGLVVLVVAALSLELGHTEGVEIDLEQRVVRAYTRFPGLPERVHQEDSVLRFRSFEIGTREERDEISDLSPTIHYYLQACTPPGKWGRRNCTEYTTLTLPSDDHLTAAVQLFDRVMDELWAVPPAGEVD